MKGFMGDKGPIGDKVRSSAESAEFVISKSILMMV